MSKILIHFILLINFPVFAFSKDIPFHNGSIIRFANVEEGKEIITKKDEFITSLSAFDRQARCQIEEPVLQEEFLEFLSEQVQEWTEPFIKDITDIVEKANHDLKHFSLPFPQIIYLVNTSGKEEGYAYYTRQNAIFIPQGSISFKIFVHELFHILSRHDAELRSRLYGIIGFHPCQNEVRLTEEWQNEWKITNPDQPILQYCIQVQYDGEPILVVPLLYPSGSYHGGNLSTYKRMYMLVIEEKENTHLIVQERGYPLLLHPDQLDHLWEQIGRNTDYYLLQPDEILAENFTLLVSHLDENLQTPRVIDEMKEILKQSN